MLHVRPPGARAPLVLCAAEGNVVTGWEVGAQPRCNLVLQPEGVSDDSALVASGAAAQAGALPPPVARSSRHSVRTLLAPFDGSYAIAAGSDMRARCWQVRHVIFM